MVVFFDDHCSSTNSIVCVCCIFVYQLGFADSLSPPYTHTPLAQFPGHLAHHHVPSLTQRGGTLALSACVNHIIRFEQIGKNGRTCPSPKCMLFHPTRHKRVSWKIQVHQAHADKAQNLLDKSKNPTGIQSFRPMLLKPRRPSDPARGVLTDSKNFLLYHSYPSVWQPLPPSPMPVL